MLQSRYPLSQSFQVFWRVFVIAITLLDSKLRNSEGIKYTPEYRRTTYVFKQTGDKLLKVNTIFLKKIH